MNPREDVMGEERF